MNQIDSFQYTYLRTCLYLLGLAVILTVGRVAVDAVESWKYRESLDLKIIEKQIELEKIKQGIIHEPTKK